MSNNKVIKITGKSFYACVHKACKGTDHYTMEVAVDDATRDKLVGMGLAPAKRLTGELVTHEGSDGTVFRLKKLAVSKDGAALPAPAVVDSQKKPVDVLIGNGSTVNVAVRTREWEFKGKTGVQGILEAIQIVDLVSYTSSAADVFSATEGFTADSTTDVKTTDDDTFGEVI